MSNDSFVRVATDGSGKRMETDLLPNAQVDSTGTTVDVHRQRANLVGDSGEALYAISQDLKKILSVLRALLAIEQNVTTLSISEEDFQRQPLSEE